MINRCINSGILGYIKDREDCREYLLKYMERYNYMYVEKHKEDYEIDNLLSKRILQHIQTFFRTKLTSNYYKTRNNKTKQNKTEQHKTTIDTETAFWKIVQLQ